jgi:hypothetical protein
MLVLEDLSKIWELKKRWGGSTASRRVPTVLAVTQGPPKLNFDLRVCSS